MQLWPAGCQFVLMIGFVLPKKGEYGEMGRHTCNRVAVLTSCGKDLVRTGFTISRSNRYRNHSSTLVGAPFLALKTVFSREKRSLVGKP